MSDAQELKPIHEPGSGYDFTPVWVKVEVKEEPEETVSNPSSDTDCEEQTYDAFTKEETCIQDSPSPLSNTEGPEYKCEEESILKSEKGEKKFNCKKCDYIAYSRKDLFQHIREHHKNKKKVTTKNKKYKCPHCAYETWHRHALKSHLGGKHNDAKPYVCEVCQYSTKYSTSLHRHRMIQHKDIIAQNQGTIPTEYKCDQCDYSSFFKNNLKLHKKNKHTDAPDKCNKSKCENGEDVKGVNVISDNVDGLNGVRLTEEGFQKFRKTFMGVLEGFKNDATSKENLESSTKSKSVKRPTKILNCDMCEYTTKYKNALEIHMRRHTNEKPFKCELCQYETKYPTSLRRHKYVQHQTQNENGGNAAVFKCDQCDYTSFYKTNLKAHYRKHSSEKQFKCNVGTCDYESAYRHCYLKHLKVHNKQELVMLQCEKCPFHTKYEGRLFNHMAKTHKIDIPNGHKCQYCDFSTKVKWRLNIHEKRSYQTNPIKCMHCDYKSQYKCQVKHHKIVHFGLRDQILEANKPESFEELGEEEGNATDYLEINHPVIDDNNDKQNECVEPEQNSQLPNINLENLTRSVQHTFQSYYQSQVQSQDYDHKSDSDSQVIPWNQIPVLENRNENKPFSCCKCPYNSRFKASVQRHFQRHHSNLKRPYKCTHCDFTTSTKDSIGLHVRRSKMNYKMDCECGNFSTIYKCELVMHQKIHNAFRCTICPYSCKQKYDLERHYLTHNGEGMKCRFCDYVAVRKHSLLCHETVHTGVKPYKCRLCEYSSVRQSLLENHIRRYHIDVVNTAISEPEVRTDGQE